MAFRGVNKSNRWFGVYLFSGGCIDDPLHVYAVQTNSSIHWNISGFNCLVITEFVSRVRIVTYLKHLSIIQCYHTTRNTRENV